MKKKLLYLIVLSFATISSFAQTKAINGKVTAQDDGLPLPGATVTIKGTNTGVQTGADGSYRITLPQGSGTLVFNFVGFATKEVAITNQTVVDVVLSADTRALTEVVVTALGVQKAKRALTYAVQTVDPTQITSSRETNIVNALAGKVAGVQINNSGGQAGSSSHIVIRGNTSLTGNNEPLFVVDGMPIDNSTNRGVGEVTESALFNGYGGNRGIDIDPSIIENVSVLKGASATALYGSRGAFGVVLITTKKGEKDASRKFPKVAFSSTLALDNAITQGYQTSYLGGSLGLYKNGLPANLGGYSEAAGGATQSSASWGPHKDSVSQAVISAIGKPAFSDPRKDFYRTGQVYNNSISLSGGANKSSYILSYSNVNQNGVVPNNTFKRNSILASFTTQLNEKFTTSTSLNYVNSDNQRMPEGNTKRSYLYSLNFAPINFDAKAVYEKAGNISWTSSTGFNNPYWLVNNISMPSVVDRVIASNESGLELLPWLKLTNRIGVDTYTDQQQEHVNIGTISVPNGRMYESMIRRTQLNNDLILSVDKDLSSDVTLSGIIGNNINTRNYARRTLRGLNLSIPEFYDITNAETTEALQADTRRRLVGVYASATVDYKNYVFLSATARNDWSSTLPKGNNSFFYPSVSAGFVFTDAFDWSNKYLQYGKLRLSYAQAGNDADEYLTNQTYIQANPSDGTRGNIAFPYNGVNGFQTNTLLSNSHLTPEIVTEKEIGTDLRFFNNRLGLDVSLYDKLSKSQILQQEIASSSGYIARVVNAGEISNKGIEVILSATPVKLKNFNWNMQVNYGKNNYKLKSIAEGVDNIFLGGFESPQIRADKDYGYGVIWGQGFKKTTDGQLLIGDDGLPVLADELGPIGNATLKWTAGLRNTFSFKSLSLSALLDIREGGDLMNMDLFYSSFYGTAKITEKRNTPYVYPGIRESDGKPNTTKIIRDQSYFQNWFSSVDQNFVEDGSFVKLREVTLSYTLPQSLISKSPFQAVGISVTGRNLWIKSDFSFGDPEGSLLGNTNGQGFYHAVTPGTRGVTFGLNVKF